MAELHGGCDSELGEPGDVLRCEALRMLDPVAQAERLPLVACLLEGVECVPVRPVADRVHRNRPAGAGRTADDVRQLLPLVISTPVPSRISAVRRPQRAVHEGLEIAETQPVVAEAGGEPEVGELVQAVVRDRLPDAQVKLSSSASRCQSRGIDASQPSLSWIAVTPREAASRRPVRIASRYSSSVVSTYRSLNCQAASSRRTPVGSPRSSSSTTPPVTWRSPFARASAAEFSQSEW